VRRKIVTILFCDVTGSTALGESLDPEALRAVLGRYFDRMKAIVERHGGTVEKFIGDAVMAVFGVPVAHEDDAFRPVRAAAEMREALPELGVQARIGVNTGEVVTGTEERLVTGDAVNVAARLEQAAQPGEILLGAMTLALARDALEVEDLDPVTLKGKAQPVTAYRLVRAREAGPRRHEMPFVGRARELGALREVWERALAERRCELVTVLAEAGVGKSRLVEEALAQLEVAVVRGRCLPYGEGISYWPVIEVLRQLDVQPSDEAAAAAVRSLLGESDAHASAEDIAWGVRGSCGQPEIWSAGSKRHVTALETAPSVQALMRGPARQGATTSADGHGSSSAVPSRRGHSQHTRAAHQPTDPNHSAAADPSPHGRQSRQTFTPSPRPPATSGSYEPRHREAPGRSAHRSKARPQRSAADMRASPPGTPQRYGPAHFHPGQIRNAYPEPNQADPVRQACKACNRT
jgi:class 3 adenylate cyclase